ncbi:MAG: hypothetical protein ACI81I_001184, partial [Arcobacteraceae bacterium]
MFYQVYSYIAKRENKSFIIYKENISLTEEYA